MLIDRSKSKKVRVCWGYAKGVLSEKLDFLKFTPENERGVKHFIAILKA